MNTFWMIAFNLVINSLFSFFTIYFICRGLLWLFRCDHPRLIGWALSLCVVKLAIDCFLYDYPHWVFAAGIDPLHAPFGSRSLGLKLGFPASFFGFTLQQIYGFSPADILASLIGIEWVKKGVLLLMGITAGRLLFFRRPQNPSQDLTPYPFPIQTPLLKKRLKNIALLISKEVNIPFAMGVWKKKIVLPERMVREQSWEEVEAVIAHELHHLRFFDPLLFWILRTVQLVFWWIPTETALRKITRSIDVDCDRAAVSYGLDPASLAGGILWAWKNKGSGAPLQLSLASRAKDCKTRIEALVLPVERKFSRRRLIIQLIAFCLIFPTLVFGKLWLF